MTEWDPDTELARHAEQYSRVHGRDPFTDAWGWAESIWSWYGTPKPSAWDHRPPPPATADHDLVITAIAEGMRLSMRHGTPIGDLNLNFLWWELRNWLNPPDDDYPLPGDDGWPAPTGPYTDQWRTWMTVTRTDPDRSTIVERHARRALKALWMHGAAQPHWPDHARLNLPPSAPMLHPWPMLAEVAPSLGRTPVPVADRDRYTGILGLDTLEQPI